MFGRLGAVRIKAAEDALSKRRLDEAFEIATAPDLAGDRRARQLLARLAEPLLQRGQDHLLDKRFPEALADFERAAQCGCAPEKINEWRVRALNALQDARDAEGARQAVIAAARERIAVGNLNSAAMVLERAPAGDPARTAAEEEIARRTQQAAEALQTAKAALKDDQVSTAVDRYLAARALHAQLDGMTEMETKLVEHVVAEAAADFKVGRLRRAEQGVAVLRDVGRGRVERTEIEEALHLAREAAKALADDRYAKASVLLGRLTQGGPEAKWINDVREHLRALEDHRRALLEGPLGLVLGHEVPSVVSTGVSNHEAPAALGETAPPGARRRISTEAVNETPYSACPQKAQEARPGEVRRGHDRGIPGVVQQLDPRVGVVGEPGVGSLPSRLLLRIDGVGSFLLLRSERIGIGRAGPGATADLQLVSDLSERQAEIIRAGEDYFVVAKSGVQLAEQHVDHALLQHGDRIRLGNRIRLKFLRPSQKSPTAVLDLGDGVRTTTDVRRVILWSGPLLMGSTRECHIHLSLSAAGMILMEREGRLLLKPMGGGAAVPLAVGTATEAGEVRLTVTPWSDSTGAGRVVG